MSRTSGIATPSNPENEQVSAESYGELKAEGDRIVREVYGSASTVVRPTYVIGPGDETDRFTYWVARTAEGGTVVGPRADAISSDRGRPRPVSVDGDAARA